MRRDAKAKKMRLTIMVSIEEEGKPHDGFQELIRIEKEMDVAPIEAHKLQTGLDPLLRQMASGSGAAGMRTRVVAAKLEDPPKQLPPGPKKPAPKKGGGNNGAN